MKLSNLSISDLKILFDEHSSKIKELKEELHKNNKNLEAIRKQNAEFLGVPDSKLILSQNKIEEKYLEKNIYQIAEALKILWVRFEKIQEEFSKKIWSVELKAKLKDIEPRLKREYLPNIKYSEKMFKRMNNLCTKRNMKQEHAARQLLKENGLDEEKFDSFIKSYRKNYLNKRIQIRK